MSNACGSYVGAGDRGFFRPQPDGYLYEVAEQLGLLGLWEYDFADSSFSWSKELYAFFRWPEESFPRFQDFLTLCHPEDREAIRKVLHQACCEDGEVSWGMRVVRPCDAIRHLRFRGKVIPESEGQRRHLVGFCQDDTKEKELETHLLDSRRSELGQRLSAGVAHDMNNLLIIIRSMGELLLKDGTDSKKVCQEILQATDRVTELTKHLLCFWRKAPPVRRFFNLGALVRKNETLLQCLVGKAITLSLQVEAGVQWVKADPARMELALIELVANARDAMPKGGKLWLKVFSSAEPDRVNGDWVVLECRDTGSGMDQATEGRAFEPFFTTKPPGKGFGLGLAQVHDAVHECGGHVVLRNEQGRGVTINLYLPHVYPPDGGRFDALCKAPNQGLRLRMPQTT